MWAAWAALDLEYDLVRPMGQKRVIAYSVYPLGRLAWSVGNGVVIMFEDITRKKEMEDQITDGRKRLKAVFDGIETQHAADIGHVERTLAKRDPGRHVKVARDDRHAPGGEPCAFAKQADGMDLAPGTRADEKCALAEGHSPCVGDRGEQFDRKSGREPDALKRKRLRGCRAGEEQRPGE